MEIRDAQKEVREVYLCGAPGTFVSAVLWSISAAVATWVSPRIGGWVLALGGALIFPALQLLLKGMGRRTTLRPENPLAALAMQSAFIIPLCLPVVGAAALHRADWFYPALMIVVGAHYLPFVTLYGMRLWYVLGGALIVAGLMLVLYGPRLFVLGGWLGAALLAVFTVVFASAAKREAGAQ
jgi:hypothetical protein